MIEFDKKRHKIAIIAPASSCGSGEENTERLEKLVQFFGARGIKCTYDEKIFSGDQLAYFAASKDERLRQLQEALLDPDVRIIFGFRGGYGCSEIVFDCIDIQLSEPKILIGFSDITVLHMLFNNYYKLPSIHGPMDARKPEMLEPIIDLLAGKECSIELRPFADGGAIVSGEVIGGNMTVLCSLLGTKLQPVTDDKILFLEDVNEKGYQVHRHLVHMYHAGLFSNIKALVFGEFTVSDEHLVQSLRSFADVYLPRVPVYSTNQIGHGDVNLPVVIGGVGKIIDNVLVVESPFELVE
jgi:muramoyltetrapeptide carboxypeptidase LdcA involved in peptidoglycan recycling